jgi:protein-disulfide isomerase
MTDSHSRDRRAAAREKARLDRQKLRRRARGTRYAIVGGVGLVIVALVVGIIVAVAGSIQPAGPGPANMAGDGITIGKDLAAVPAGAQGPTVTPSATATAATGQAVKIAVYFDYLCPICGSFEKSDNAYIKGLVQSGAATVEYHPIAILNNQSLGTKYSQRAANAGACVADHSPDSFFAFNTAMFAKQPAEGTSGLSDEQLIALVKGLGSVSHLREISTCITDQTFSAWVVSATQRALAGPIAGASISKIRSTPTILVNGEQYKYTTPFKTSEFSNFVVTAAGNSYADTATSTPTPMPAPKSSATPTAKATPTK